MMMAMKMKMMRLVMKMNNKKMISKVSYCSDDNQADAEVNDKKYLQSYAYFEMTLVVIIIKINEQRYTEYNFNHNYTLQRYADCLIDYGFYLLNVDCITASMMVSIININISITIVVIIIIISSSSS